MFDVICSGDGELAIFEALKRDAPQFIDGDDHKGPLFMNNDIYGASPFPARHMIDLPSYKYQIEDQDATSLIAQLGCPFNCGFCGGRNSKSLRVIRTRTTESVIQEVELLHKEYGYTGFMFYDDEMNVNKDMVPLMWGLVELQDKLGVEFRLRGYVKAELFNEMQAEAMYRAGFRWLLTGFEAADPRILINIDKRATLEDNTRVVEISKKYDLKIKALMSIGHPGENESTVSAIRDWLISCEVDDFDVTVITPYPGTPYFDLAEPHDKMPNVWTYTHPKTGDRQHAFELDYSQTADYYKGVPEEGYTSFVFTDHLSSEKIVELRDWLEKDVHSKLGIPYNASRAAVRFEHTMGQGLPSFVLKKVGQESSRGPDVR